MYACHSDSFSSISYLISLFVIYRSLILISLLSVTGTYDMGSTEILNRTSRSLDVHVGNSRYSVKLATLEAYRSYTVHVNLDDTYMELSLRSNSIGKVVTVTSDECVDNRTVIIREVDGQFQVEMQPRVLPSRKTAKAVIAKYNPFRRRLCTSWRLSIF